VADRPRLAAVPPAGRPATITLDAGTAGTTTLFQGGTSQATAGSAPFSKAFAAQDGGTITFNNGTGTTAFSRISAKIGGADVPVTLANGTLRINGATGTTGIFTQQAGSLTGGGFSTVVVNTSSATTEGIGLNFASLSRGPGAQRGTFLFNGGNASFGAAAAGPGVPLLTFTTPPITAANLGTPAATIIPYAIGSQTATGVGRGLVTYDANGVRLLDPWRSTSPTPPTCPARSGRM
jgi:hypothetical protein